MGQEVGCTKVPGVGWTKVPYVGCQMEHEWVGVENSKSGGVVQGHCGGKSV